MVFKNSYVYILDFCTKLMVAQLPKKRKIVVGQNRPRTSIRFKYSQNLAQDPARMNGQILVPLISR